MKIDRVFEGFWFAFMIWATILSIGFTLIIQNVTFLPTIQDQSVQFLFAICTAFIGIAMAYFSLRFSHLESEKLKEKLKKQGEKENE